MRLLPCGDRAVLVELDDPATVLGVDAALRRSGVDGTVPGARTVLVPLVDGDRARTERLVHAAVAEPAPTPGAAHEVLLDVRYDGPDLGDVAAAARLTVDDVVARHSGGTYTVAFCGFAPGFAYLTGLPPELHVPRLATPRARVPAGAVAVAGGYAAVYPRASPGGWRLLGTTDATLWDLDRDPPALLTPGTTVRFRPT